MADLQQKLSFIYHSIVEDRKKLIIVLASIVVVLILLFAIFGHHSARSVDPEPKPEPEPGSCKILEELPKRIDLQTVEPVADQNKTALVRLAGYLSVPHGKDAKHYELRQTSMRTSLMPYSNTLVHIETDCADVVLEIHKDVDFRIKTMRIRPNELDAGFQECLMTVESSSDLWFNLDEQYICDRLLRYDCVDTLGDRSVIKSLVFELQLELEGNPAKISRGEFSKKVRFCPIS